MGRPWKIDFYRNNPRAASLCRRLQAREVVQGDGTRRAWERGGAVCRRGVRSPAVRQRAHPPASAAGTARGGSRVPPPSPPRQPWGRGCRRRPVPWETMFAGLGADRHPVPEFYSRRRRWDRPTASLPEVSTALVAATPRPGHACPAVRSPALGSRGGSPCRRPALSPRDERHSDGRGLICLQNRDVERCNQPKVRLSSGSLPRYLDVYESSASAPRIGWL